MGKLHNLNISRNFTRMVKSRRMAWVRYMTSITEEGNAQRVLVRNLKETENLQDLCVDGRIIFKCTLKKKKKEGHDVD